MPKHRDITGIDAVHPFAYIQATDPAEDEDNEVAAGKALAQSRARARGCADGLVIVIAYY